MPVLVKYCRAGPDFVALHILHPTAVIVPDKQAKPFPCPGQTHSHTHIDLNFQTLQASLTPPFHRIRQALCQNVSEEQLAIMSW